MGVSTKIKEQFWSAITVLSPKLNTKLHYRRVFGKKLDLDNPQTFNEKILWLKLKRYMHNPLVIQCADKYRVRDYVIKCGCGDILNELIGAYNSADEIPWQQLPKSFVLKWNFGAKMNFICLDKSKVSETEIVAQFRKWGKRKYWLQYSEMQYKYAPKKIVCEKLLGKPYDPNVPWEAPEDYKVYCFNGVPKYVMVCVGRKNGQKPHFYFFDTNWKLARINHDGKAAPENFTIEKPACMDALFEAAAKLSKPFPFVRADFYIVDDKVYFGELTFTPATGLDKGYLPETDRMFGDMVDLHFNPSLDEENKELL